MGIPAIFSASFVLFVEGTTSRFASWIAVEKGKQKKIPGFLLFPLSTKRALRPVHREGGIVGQFPLQSNTPQTPGAISKASPGIAV